MEETKGKENQSDILNVSRNNEKLKFYKNLNIENYKNLYVAPESSNETIFPTEGSQYNIFHDNKRNSVSFKKYSSLDQPRIKVENVVNSRVKGSHHSSKDNEIIIKQNQNSKEQHMHGIRNSNNPNEGKIIHENKEHSVFVVGERINPSVNISSCQTQRNMDCNYNFNNLEPFNADSKGYSSREYGVERSNAPESTKETSDKNCIFRSRRNTNQLRTSTTEQYSNLYGITPGSNALNRITPFFDVNSKEIELNSGKDDRRRHEMQSVESNCTDLTCNIKTNNYTHGQSIQVSNSEMMQFMKAQIQEVREEFMGALKELINISKANQSFNNSEIIGDKNDSEKI